MYSMVCMYVCLFGCLFVVCLCQGLPGLDWVGFGANVFSMFLWHNMVLRVLVVWYTSLGGSWFSRMVGTHLVKPDVIELVM